MHDRMSPRRYIRDMSSTTKLWIVIGNLIGWLLAGVPVANAYTPTRLLTGLALSTFMLLMCHIAVYGYLEPAYYRSNRNTLYGIGFLTAPAALNIIVCFVISLVL